MAKWFKFSFLPFLIFLLQWLLYLSCRKEFKGTLDEDKACVLLFWHSRLALMAFIFRHFCPRDKRAFVMISRHKDGEFIARNIKFFGINAIRGSSSKGANKALKEAFKVLENNDYVVITPDGPRGPKEKIKDGAILIAQKMKTKIRIINYEASSFWRFKSWDELILPKPFSRLVYSLSEAFDVRNLEKEAAKAFLQEKFAKIAKDDSFLTRSK